MKKSDDIARIRLTLRGRVQGVGFRPAVHRALTARGCAGSVRNTPEGAVIEAEGPEATLAALVIGLRDLLPARARVDEMTVEHVPPLGETGFRIVPSESDGLSLLPVPPDLATCADCLRELAEPGDRRRGYAFNTCTACGPRFTITREVPFDRPTNAMADFPPCADCLREYGEPADRRFHAQTISCPACGPTLRLLDPDGRELDDPLGRARNMLADGAIIAVKGIGGFHLACDASRDDVVRELRRRKGRFAKPFAVMAADLATCERICHVSDFERALLTGPEAPVVLLRKRAGCPVAESVAPGLADLGVMLPCTPLHCLLFSCSCSCSCSAPPMLVMTSCNRSEEPIAVSEEHVLADLRDLVDGVLTHNRPIVNRCDDSVVAALDGAPIVMRRSRGYVPEPILLDIEGPSVFATGGMMRNAFALTSGRRAFLSQHIGDVSDADNAEHFARSFRDFARLLRLEPEAVVCDLHPDYPTTHFARALCAERGLPLMQMQQHHAHVVSCLAEHGHRGPVIGVSWDGSGYGTDGAVWGGEFLVADRREFERRYHLGYVPMPGGEQAVWRPCRMALAHLADALGPDAAAARLASRMDEDPMPVLALVGKREFSPLTSSAGRLFDAVAALLGVCTQAAYDGQPACELEAVLPAGADLGGAAPYEFGYDGQEIVLGPMWRGLCEDMDAGAGTATISARFHRTMAQVIVETCGCLRAETGIRAVAMSGGVMQNRALVRAAVSGLREDGFAVLLQTRVPPNDGGLCLGQAAWALARLG